MTRNDELAELGCTALRETDKALYVDLGDKKTWIPKSLIHDDSEVWKAGQSGTLVIPEWFALKEGLI